MYCLDQRSPALIQEGHQVCFPDLPAGLAADNRIRCVQSASKKSKDSWKTSWGWGLSRTRLVDPWPTFEERFRPAPSETEIRNLLAGEGTEAFVWLLKSIFASF